MSPLQPAPVSALTSQKNALSRFCERHLSQKPSDFCWCNSYPPSGISLSCHNYYNLMCYDITLDYFARRLFCCTLLAERLLWEAFAHRSASAA